MSDREQAFEGMGTYILSSMLPEELEADLTREPFAQI